jgi:serine O-acetyltransferase
MRLDDQCLQLYRVAHNMWKDSDLKMAERYYQRVRTEHGCELYYEIVLPKNVMLVHPVGTVLGRATYGDYLCVYQNVGVGSDVDGNRPVLGKGVVLFPGAKVLGNTKIGNNVFITANTVVQNVDIPDNSVVFPFLEERKKSDHKTRSVCSWKPTERSVIKEIFKVKHG